MTAERGLCRWRASDFFASQHRSIRKFFTVAASLMYRFTSVMKQEIIPLNAQDRASKTSLFSRASSTKRDKRRSQPPPADTSGGGRRYHSLGRRRERRQSGGGDIPPDRWRPDPTEQSAVASKSNEMFS